MRELVGRGVGVQTCVFHFLTSKRTYVPTHKDEEQQERGQEAAAVCGRHEPQQREGERGEGHGEELCPGASKHREKQRRELRGAEDVPMHELPAGLLCVGVSAVCHV